MATEYGKDWRIMIGDGKATEAFVQIGGEGSFEFKRASDSLDFSSKDDGVYKAKGWGQQEVTISVSGIVKLPDPGLERADAVAKAITPETNFKIMKGTIVKFVGRVGIGNFSLTAGKDGPVSYSFDAVPVQAPTTDTMMASS